MGRPRGFDVSVVVEAAKDRFWQHGYNGSTLDDLEEVTGLSRSSLYQAFGTKEALFTAALGSYIDTFVEPRLAPMYRPGAAPRDVVSFFAELARRFRDDVGAGRRGCLWVNSLAEFSGREPAVDPHGLAYRHRMQRAFANALSGPHRARSASVALVDRRSRMLVATTLGIWLSARIDPAEAALVCDVTAAEVRRWARDAPRDRRRPPV